MIAPRARFLVAALVGFVFSLGLGISGMTQPQKVLGFLDVSGGAWDPALAFVMGGAILVYATGYWLVIRRRAAPRLAERFELPKEKAVDGRLLSGAALFGLGWGVSGLCPGPALTAMVTLAPKILVFLAAMLLAMALFDRLDARQRRADG